MPRHASWNADLKIVEIKRELLGHERGRKCRMRFVGKHSPGVLISVRHTTKQERAFASSSLEHALPRLLTKELSLLSIRNEIENEAVVISKRS